MIDPTGLARVILLIDGSKHDAELMETQFRELGVKTDLRFVTDGEEAIQFLLKMNGHQLAPRPDLIFLDLDLAVAGGFEMLILAKNDPRFARIPIIVFSNSVNDDLERAYGLHANCCVEKPRTPAELIKFVEFIKSFWLEMLILPLQ